MSANIHFFLEDVSYRVQNKRVLRQWIEDSAAKEKRSVGPLNFILCSDDHLHRMNVEYLEHDTLTDIITFDYTEGTLISGDLFISIDRVKENAKELGVKTIDELHRVFIHGVLHLCGYKDKSLEDSRLMRSKEDLYLSLRPF